jgi:hypothetical protein
VNFIIGRTVSLTNIHIGVIFDAEEHACLVQESLTVLYKTFGWGGRSSSAPLGCLRSTTCIMPTIEIRDCKSLCS